MKTLWAIVLLMTGIGIAMAFLSLELWWARPVLIPIRALPPTTTPSPDAALIKEQVEYYSKRADDLQKLLTVLITISSFYAIAIGLNAYRQAKESEDDLKQIDLECEKVAQKIKDRVYDIFPMFENIDLNIRSTMSKITGLLPQLDLAERRFRDLSNRQREQILFYEKTVSPWETLNLDRETTSEAYHGLGNFYALRAASEDEAAEVAVPDAAKAALAEVALQDVERARFYLDRAIELHAQNVGALNDRYLALRLDKPERLDDAREVFERSLQANAEQQRARYNLALVKHKAPAPDYEGSIQLLNEALGFAKWQKTEVPKRRSEILYNRACSKVRLGATKSDPTALLTDAMRDLREAFSNEEIDWKSVGKPFFDDLKPGGDLRALFDIQANRPVILTWIGEVNRQLGTNKTIV